MSLSLIGRRAGRRVVQWGRVCNRVLGMAVAAVLLTILIFLLVITFTEGPFLQSWWGEHLFTVLILLLVLGQLLGVVAPLVWGRFVPTERLTDLDAPPQEPRPKARYGMRGWATLLGIAILALLFYAEENWRGKHAWQQYQRQEEARGRHMQQADVVPPPVPDQENFASTPFFVKFFEGFPVRGQTGEVDFSPRVTAFAPRYDAATQRMKPSHPTRTNSWVPPAVDLAAWAGAFLKGTNAIEPDFPEGSEVSPAAVEAFRRRYGLPPSEPASMTTAKPATKPPVQTNVLTRAEAAKVVLEALAECDPVLEELRAASRRPHSRFNLRYDTENPMLILLPHYALLKRITQVLQLRASAELALGQTEAASEDIQFLFRLVDVTRDEPFLITHLVRIAQLQIALQPLAEGLTRHQWSEAQLRTFEERLQQYNFFADAQRALEGERVFFGGGWIDYVLRSPSRYQALKGLGGDQNAMYNSGFDGQSALLATFPSGWFYLEKLNYSRMFGDYLLPAVDVQNRRMSPDDCRKGEDYLNRMHMDPGLVVLLRHRLLSGMLLPALTRSVQKFAVAQTGADVVTVACALERYRLAHAEYPETLGALAPEYIKQLPHDIITGQPLKYQRTEQGQYVLYSVGWNQVDDGGKLALSKSGSGIDFSEGDWVWRLPP